MMAKKLKKLFFITLLLGLVGPLQAADLILTTSTGLAANDRNAFVGIITGTTKAYDPYTGDIYVGTYPSTLGDGAACISKATRAATDFLPLAKEATTRFATALKNSQMVNGISLLNKGNAAATNVACLTETFSNEIFLIDLSDSTYQTINSVANTDRYLCDANAFRYIASMLTGTSNNDYLGLRNTDISLIETNSTHVFARVNSKNGDMANGAGIALLGFKSNLTTFSVIQGNQNAATSALELDKTTSVANVRTSLTNSFFNNLLTFTVMDMHWNTSLERLFIAAHTETGLTDNDGAIALIKGKITTGGILELERMYNGDPSLIGDDMPSAVFTTRTSTDGNRYGVKIHKVRHMETSTGFQYLIVNGGKIGLYSGLQPGDWGNKIFALRIAQNSDDSGVPAAGKVKCGDIIRNDTLVETSLAAANFLNLALLDSAIVGSSDLPWDYSTTCSDLVVVGDTVYASGFISGGRRAANDPGVWKSQAMFREDGLITGWTKWERIYPSQGQTTATDDNSLAIEVDALNGKIWHIGNDKKTVHRTGWNDNFSDTSKLAYRLSNDFADGCYCMLDLPGGLASRSGNLALGTISNIAKQVPGIGGTPGRTHTDDYFNSYTLFGGYEKVVFARTSYTVAAKTYGQVQVDYGTGNDSKYLLTDASNGLSGAGAIRCLGYSYNNEGDATNINEEGKGFFFAGTDNGLYIYSKEGGVGFNGSYGLSSLNTAPLFISTDNSTWSKLESSNVLKNHAIDHIVTMTDKVYCVGIDLDTGESLQDKIFQLTLETDREVMVPTAMVKAQSGSGSLPTNALFTGFTIIANQAGDAGFGILSTNNGLYTTTCQVDQLALATGEWTEVFTTTGQPFYSINKLKDTREVYDFSTTSSLRARTFSAVGFTDGSAGLGIYQNSTLLQGGIVNDGNASKLNGAIGGQFPVRAVPQNDTLASANTLIADRTYALNKDTTTIQRLDFTTNLWTDGGRRLYTRFDPDEDNVWNKLCGLPFNSAKWNRATTGSFDLTVSDTTLTTYDRLYWIENIAGTGQILAGTDTGVISLD